MSLIISKVVNVCRHKGNIKRNCNRIESVIRYIIICSDIHFYAIEAISCFRSQAVAVVCITYIST